MLYHPSKSCQVLLDEGEQAGLRAKGIGVMNTKAGMV
jgi:hypothetical protein